VRAQQRRKRLQEKFGSEYDRAMDGESNRRAAEQELEHREKRHAQLDIRPLSPAAHERYSQNWASIQQQFVDRPATAVVEADRVLTELMAERGYPTEGFEQQLADLSVEHSRTLEHYRTAHGTMLRQRENKGDTEDLRSAMLHYRTLFEELLDTGDVRQQRQVNESPPTTPVARQAPPQQQGAQHQGQYQPGQYQSGQYQSGQYQSGQPGQYQGGQPGQQPPGGYPQQPPQQSGQYRQPAGGGRQPVQPDQPIPGGPPAQPGRPMHPGQQYAPDPGLPHTPPDQRR